MDFGRSRMGEGRGKLASDIWLTMRVLGFRVQG